jgi:hypothetical protein
MITSILKKQIWFLMQVILKENFAYSSLEATVQIFIMTFKAQRK